MAAIRTVASSASGVGNAKPASSLRALLKGIVDYAGLFPPAGLSMKDAVRKYSEYLHARHCWMLGRFVVPAGRLREFGDALAALNSAPKVWRLSCLLGKDLPSDLAKIRNFQAECSSQILLDCLEAALPQSNLGPWLASLPSDFIRYVELPLHSGLPMLSTLHGAGVRAKIRAGGITPESIPASVGLAQFLGTCKHAGIAFKATAGLHHPLRCVKPLTYEPGSSHARMHGFLNLALGAALAYQHVPAELVESTLDLGAASLRFESDHIVCNGIKLSVDQLVETRTSFFTSFGSCSFEEPIADLEALNLL